MMSSTSFTNHLLLFPSIQFNTPPKPLAIHGPRVHWYRPVTLPRLLALRDRYPQHRDRSKPQYRLVVGNTEIGVEVRLKGAHYPVLIAPTHVPELHVLEMTDRGLLVGAAVTLTDLWTKLQKLISSLPGEGGVFVIGMTLNEHCIHRLPYSAKLKNSHIRTHVCACSVSICPLH